MFDYKEWFVSPNTPVRGQPFVNYITSYTYVNLDIMNNDNFATLLECFVNTSELWVAQVNINKVLGLNHFVLAKKWDISPKKALHTICHATQWLYPSMPKQFRRNNQQSWYRRLLCNMYSDTLFATTVSRRDNRCTQIFAANFGWSCLFPMKMKSEAHGHCHFSFSRMGCHLQLYVTIVKK